jgi:hypothetical protein
MMAGNNRDTMASIPQSHANGSRAAIKLPKLFGCHNRDGFAG